MFKQLSGSERWVLEFIKQGLISGQFLILPESIYDHVIDICEKHGMPEEALVNIHKSEYLRPFSVIE